MLISISVFLVISELFQLSVYLTIVRYARWIIQQVLPFAAHKSVGMPFARGLLVDELFVIL